MMQKHVHILISPKLNANIIHEEVVPVVHERRVVAYYVEKGWDVLAINDDEVCGARQQ